MDLLALEGISFWPFAFLERALGGLSFFRLGAFNSTLSLDFEQSLPVWNLPGFLPLFLALVLMLCAGGGVFPRFLRGALAPEMRGDYVSPTRGGGIYSAPF